MNELFNSDYNTIYTLLDMMNAQKKFEEAEAEKMKRKGKK